MRAVVVVGESRVPCAVLTRVLVPESTRVAMQALARILESMVLLKRALVRSQSAVALAVVAQPEATATKAPRLGAARDVLVPALFALFLAQNVLTDAPGKPQTTHWLRREQSRSHTSVPRRIRVLNRQCSGTARGIHRVRAASHAR